MRISSNSFFWIAWAFIVSVMTGIGIIMSNEEMSQYKILIIIGISSVVFIILIIRSISIWKSHTPGLPSEDEFSNNIRLHAGYQAFKWSMKIWVFMFILFQFYPAGIRTTLGLGILGASVMYGICRLYYARTGNFDLE